MLASWAVEPKIHVQAIHLADKGAIKVDSNGGNDSG
jgi:hypothetical protein